MMIVGNGQLQEFNGPVKNIDFILKFIFVCLAISIIWHSFMSLFGFGYPWTTFLFDPTDRFNDFWNSVYSSRNLRPYQEESPAIPAYFPFAYVFFYLFSFFSKGCSSLVFLLALFLTFIKSIKSIYSYISCYNITVYFKLFLIFLLAYPTIFSIDRGNLDIIVALAIIIFFFSYMEGKFLVACLWLVFAASLKGYPLIYLAYPLFFRKDIRFTLLSFILFIAVSFFAFLLFDGDLNENVKSFFYSLQRYRETYVIGFGSVKYNSDIYDLIKLIIIYIAGKSGYITFSQSFLAIYHWVAFGIVILGIAKLYFSHLDNFRAIAIITVLALIFPDVSSDYKFCLMLLPLAIFIFQFPKLAGRPNLILMLMIIQLVPKKFIYIYGVAVLQFINAIALSVMLVILLTDIFYTKSMKPFNKCLP